MELPVLGKGAGSQPRPSAAPEFEPDDTLEQKVVKVLRTVHDPEIPVNIFDLGLIYGLDVDEAGAVKVRMTLTSPACPVAGSLPREVESKVRSLAGASSVEVALVWDPPWSAERMSEAARLQLGLL